MMTTDWQIRTEAALQWLRRSIAATGGQGSAHSWHPLLGWSKAYPETTGYLVETLLNYAEIRQDESLRQLALAQVKWLDSVQFPSGAFPSLLVGNTQPSVFNTSQILFAAPHLKGTEAAVQWLLAQLEPDGAWRVHAFVPGFVPSYYTRAVWGVLKANQVVQYPEVESLMRKSLDFYAARFLPNGAVQDWGFKAGAPAFTHTLAYTLEGFWESALHLNAPQILQQTMDSVSQLLKVRAAASGRTAGRYDTQWRGDYRFVCVTGNCQLSVLCQKIWAHTGDPTFKAAANSFLEEILPFQKLGSNPNTYGAFSGSSPIWGAYLPFRYPNWGLKFFLDAVAKADLLCVECTFSPQRH